MELKLLDSHNHYLCWKFCNFVIDGSLIFTKLSLTDTVERRSQISNYELQITSYFIHYNYDRTQSYCKVIHVPKNHAIKEYRRRGGTRYR
jgi:hypothetical protein